MSAPTVASLCSSLGGHLTTAPGFTVTSAVVSAVHISELPEPNAYLAGGELLLTTGLVLPEDEAGCRRYVARLVEAEISALAFGLGPVHERVPAALVAACKEAGLVLLVVPAATGFLTISSAYWAARSRSTERQLNDAVAAQRALVDAAAAVDPVASILQRLARTLDGWVALLDAAGEIDLTYPTSFRDDAADLRDEVARLEVAGVHSSASFTIADHVVAVFPLAVGDRIVGYLAAGSPRRLEPTQRQVILTAVVLLSLDVLRIGGGGYTREANRRCVALLVDSGMVDAARRLAAETGSPVPGREMRVLAARGRSSDDLVATVEAWCPAALAVRVDCSTAWFVLPADGEIGDLVNRVRAADPSGAVVASDLVASESAGATRVRLLRALHGLAAGEAVLPRTNLCGVVPRAVERFAAEASAELREALVGYLRHRGQWEQAARALTLHRNTLRYRVSRALEILGLDLDDPDLAAETWLALRDRGLA
ncbi:purine catabolism regulatory protein [Prauserella flava]|nr:purine catabolism regulatory protein [Prauserella flava]MCR3735946.1 purine catabolism regulatory protein [Prauserella salsuginis]